MNRFQCANVSFLVFNARYSTNSELTPVNNVFHMILHSISSYSVHEFIKKRRSKNLDIVNYNHCDLKSRLIDDAIETIKVSLLGGGQTSENKATFIIKQ